MTPATLTVTANDQSRPYGTPNPALDATISGFVNGETLATSDVTGSPACSTTAVTTSPVSGSPYPITCTAGTLASANYTFAFAAGELTDHRGAAWSITADDQSKPYGTTFTFAGTEFTATGLQGTDTRGLGDPHLGRQPGAAARGRHPVPDQRLGRDRHGLANYTISYVPGSLTITPVTLTVTANDKSRPYGTPNPALDATISGFVNGETLATSDVTGSPACSTTAVTTSPVSGRPYPITCTAGTLASVNYTFAFAAGELTDHRGQPGHHRRRPVQALRHACSRSPAPSSRSPGSRAPTRVDSVTLASAGQPGRRGRGRLAVRRSPPRPRPARASPTTPSATCRAA